MGISRKGGAARGPKAGQAAGGGLARRALLSLVTASFLLAGSPVPARSQSPAQAPPPAGTEETPPKEVPPPGGKEAEPAAIRAGDPFPALPLIALYPGGERPAPVDLGSVLGKRPVVFAYFILTHQISEEILLEVQRLVAAETQGKVAFYPVARLGKRFELSELVERMRLLGIAAPVVLDEDGRLQKALQVGVVPAIALIDGKGRVAFTRATSLKQPVRDPVNVGEAIRIAARGEDPPVVARLDRYLPASDLAGERFRDFTLPDYKTGETLKLSDRIKQGRVTALFYWGVTCELSKVAMPAFVTAHKSFGGRYLDIISVVRDREKAKVEAFATEQGIRFPILQDRQGRFTSLYRVVSTPTLIIIRPDGVVDSVQTSGWVNYFTLLQAKVMAFAPRPSAAPGR